MCGHQNPKVNTGLEYGDIRFELLEKIAREIPPTIIVQFHRDGEPTVYSRLHGALELFRGHIRSIVTHGENLVHKADQIIGACETLTVSAFDPDPDGAEQIEVLRGFLHLKGDRKPNVNVKIVGSMAAERQALYDGLGVPVLRRSLHHPGGDYRYKQTTPPVPESGICLDFLSHPSVDWCGNVFQCNRLDSANFGLIGNLQEQTLEEIWNGEKRLAMLQHHINGRRDLANKLCRDCTYWGIPTNG